MIACGKADVGDFTGIHAFWFYKKRCKTATTGSFLKFWDFPVVGFLSSKTSFLTFQKNDTMVSYFFMFIAVYYKNKAFLLDTST